MDIDSAQHHLVVITLPQVHVEYRGPGDYTIIYDQLTRYHYCVIRKDENDG